MIWSGLVLSHFQKNQCEVRFYKIWLKMWSDYLSCDPGSALSLFSHICTCKIFFFKIKMLNLSSVRLQFVLTLLGLRTLKERAHPQLLCKVIWPIFNPPKIIARYKCIFQKNVFTSNKKKPNKIMGYLVTLESSKTLWKSTIAFFGTFRRKS